MSFYLVSQKSYKGQTANQILKTARVVEMRAGNFEIVVDTKRAYNVIVSMTACGDMVLDYPGVTLDKPILLETGKMAHKKLATLNEEVERRYLEVAKSIK